jgi:alpha,alpha-trehalase
MTPPFPYDQLPLFEAVQSMPVFADSKTFVDCTPKTSWEDVNSRYISRRNDPGFNLRLFVHENFELPHVFASDYTANRDAPVEDHIQQLWPYLTREPETDHGSLLALPFPYIVPGGRFGEIYYWDSYFTMLGLAVSGRIDMVEHMVNNFAFLIDRIGFIPNGNRTYYLGRSQPPFFAAMVQLLMKYKGEQVLLNYTGQLQREYNWWMSGCEDNAFNFFNNHCVYVDGGVLNRYWDLLDTARPEAWREDRELALHNAGDASRLYRHLRAGAASGWDYSSRWFIEPQRFASIETAEIVPIDLNCLLWNLEGLLVKAFELSKDADAANQWQERQQQREGLIQRYCWNEEKGFFFDYHAGRKQQMPNMTLAAAFPLFMGIATPEQALRVAQQLSDRFLHAGGLITTLEQTGQQWDAPNGWAPLQFICISGLERYGFHQLAKEIALRWVRLNRDVFHRTGKMMEKYNVVDTHLEAGGGEYAGQDGFGWTNGVFLALTKHFQL